jgi:hypothetical protein
MRSEHQLNTFDIAILAATRAMLGAGVGLLVARRFSDEQRLAIGRTLVAIGGITTVPLVFRIFGARRQHELPPAAI